METGGVRSFSTIGDLIDGGWNLWRVCPKGCPEGKIDLAILAERYGRDATYVRPASPIRIKCARCGVACPSYVMSHP
jgi:hypothetical protein